MSPEDFEALLRLADAELLEKYRKIAEKETARRRKPDTFEQNLWAQQILKDYKEAIVLKKLNRRLT